MERADTTAGSIEWHGLRFEPLATTFGIADPPPAQLDQLTACWEHCRTNLPPDMKIELYGNRVRIEPGAFGARAELITTLGGFPGRVLCPTIRKSRWDHRSGARLTRGSGSAGRVPRRYRTGSSGSCRNRPVSRRTARSGRSTGYPAAHRLSRRRQDQQALLRDATQ
ncbi:hypothetical protein AB0H83_41270 [Dactylosporangium sp. NPDC050688]|uniref:hypothetical protein n=1 Tax=Dactylosporangium sp. NPDC050688 TaxID=3157217 RepID=UPI0033E2ABA1